MAEDLALVRFEPVDKKLICCSKVSSYLVNSSATKALVHSNKLSALRKIFEDQFPLEKQNGTQKNNIL